MQARAASLLFVACASTGLVLSSCNDDGRTLRDPRPDQVGSVSTTAAPTTTTFDPQLDQLDQLDPLSIDPALDSADVGGAVGAGDTSAPLEGFVEATWMNGGAIPDRHTCNGENIAPAIRWSPSPTGTVEIAITMVDEQNPGFVHWAVSGIDPFATSLEEGAVPEFAVEGINSNGLPGYTGPCPPAGATHTYVLTVHFLDQQTELGDGAAGADLQGFINGASFQRLSSAGTYSQV